MKTLRLFCKLSLLPIFLLFSIHSFAQEEPKKDVTELINLPSVAKFFENSNAIYVVRNAEVCDRYNCEGDMTLFEKPVMIMRKEEKFMLKPVRYISLEPEPKSSQKIKIQMHIQGNQKD